MSCYISSDNGRRALRLRPNIFLVSSLLLTPAFFWLLPYVVRCAEASDDMTRTAGLASLTVIIVALIVIWTWLAAGSRVAWVIMAVIVWVWAFPIMIFRPHIGPLSSSELKDWVVSAWRQDGFARVTLINPIMFSLMLIGLIVPVRTLLRIGKPE
jgi:fatty acid desaturase